jgi:hypothetical protein
MYLFLYNIFLVLYLWILFKDSCLPFENLLACSSEDQLGLDRTMIKEEVSCLETLTAN